MSGWLRQGPLRNLAIGVAVGALALTAGSADALSYTARGASPAEVSAIVSDAKLTQPCGYDGTGHLSKFRVVQYAAKGAVISWAETSWTTPGTDPCVLVFLHAAGYSFASTQTPRHERVDWLPFTWGSAPFENAPYLDHQWQQLNFKANPPRWLALEHALEG